MNGEIELFPASEASKRGSNVARAVAVGLLITGSVIIGFLTVFRVRPVQEGKIILTRPGGPPAALLQEATLRNVTGKDISYIIKSAPSGNSKSHRSLPQGSLDRLVSDVPFKINYERGSRLAEYTIFPGKPYCFRLDENGLVKVYPGSHRHSDAPDLAPFVPSPEIVVDTMLGLAGVGPSDVVYDIGCGDGRIVIEAAARFGARGVGIDIDPELIETCRENAEIAGVKSLVRFICADASRARFAEASVIAVYLLPESLDFLKPLWQRDLKDGTRIVSHDYKIPGWDGKVVSSRVVEDERKRSHKIFLYRFSR